MSNTVCNTFGWVQNIDFPSHWHVAMPRSWKQSNKSGLYFFKTVLYNCIDVCVSRENPFRSIGLRDVHVSVSIASRQFVWRHKLYWSMSTLSGDLDNDLDVSKVSLDPDANWTGGWGPASATGSAVQTGTEGVVHWVGVKTWRCQSRIWQFT